MTLAIALLAFISLQRLAELVWARRNTALLSQAGAVEIAPGHYPLIVITHALWLACLWWFGWDKPVNFPWLAVAALLQLGRMWVLITLGARWTTRILIVPGEKLVRAGPYRFFAHPNYAVVAGEIFALPMALGLPWVAACFTLINAGALLIRIRAENKALGR